MIAVYEWLATVTKPVRMAEVAEGTQLSERRTKVILAELDAMGVVRRRPGGTFTRVRELSVPELSEFARSFEARFVADRGKLDEMMRYAQATRCRTSLVVEYFGEEHIASCAHCDNCRDGVAVALAQPSPRPMTPDAEAPRGRFTSGDRVRHVTLGEGVIEDLGLVHIRVRFDRGGPKLVVVDGLSSIAS